MNGVAKSFESDDWKLRLSTGSAPPGPLNDHVKFPLSVSTSNATFRAVGRLNVYASVSPATEMSPLTVAPSDSAVLATVTGRTLNAYVTGAAPALRRPSTT